MLASFLLQLINNLSTVGTSYKLTKAEARRVQGWQSCP